MLLSKSLPMILNLFIYYIHYHTTFWVTLCISCIFLFILFILPILCCFPYTLFLYLAVLILEIPTSAVWLRYAAIENAIFLMGFKNLSFLWICLKWNYSVWWLRCENCLFVFFFQFLVWLLMCRKLFKKNN